MTRNENKQELPPFVKTWRQFYVLLVFWLLLLILGFYLFTIYFK
jgi:DMSO reductase anchor subunit